MSTLIAMMELTATDEAWREMLREVYEEADEEEELLTRRVFE